MARDPFPFSITLSSGGYRIAGTRPDREIEVFSDGEWCGWISLDHGQVHRVCVTPPAWAPPFPQLEAVKALRRILGTPDEASQVDS